MRPAGRKNRGEVAFTLFEALIAMGIFALIGMLSFGTFSRAIATRERADVITSRYHEIRQAMLRMATEISLAYLSAHHDCDEKRTETIFVGERSGNGMRLDFTSFSHFKIQADANESDQNELSYFVDQDPEDHQRTALMRREQSRVDDEPQEGGVEQVLAEGVTELSFRFYDAKDDEWVDDWDSKNMDQKQRLPMFVSIELKAMDHMGKEETFVTKTRIFLKREILITGTGYSRCIE